MKKKSIIITIIVVGILVIIGLLLICNKQVKKSNEVSLVKTISLESGSKPPTLKDLVDKGNLSEYAKITIYDDKGKTISLKKIYLDSNNNEVDETVAKEGDKLRKGYKEEEVIVTPGNYKIKVVDKNKTYTIKLNIKDTTPPTLTLKDVEVNENDDVQITSFIDKCTDNSYSECTYKYVDENGADLQDIDKSVGVHQVNIQALDPTGNKSNIVNAKLTIKAIPVSNNTPTNNRQTNSNNTSNNITYDRSNPVAACALDMVGQTGVMCSQVVNNCLSRIGKTLSMRKDYGSYWLDVIDPNNIKELGYTVPISSLVPGDIVYYEDGGYGASHIAVFIGNGKAVHGGFDDDKKVVIYSIYLPRGSSPIGYKIK